MIVRLAAPATPRTAPLEGGGLAQPLDVVGRHDRGTERPPVGVPEKDAVGEVACGG
ncbi:hypothetical protein AB0F81_13110 [Actinoplanes sp. NPDC024001]|uniref:hypothetical protein n=1 Tax=Actinoplanes sp. NPDC024001 TaxID=3154598 RepID=UPI0033C7B258